MFKLIGHILLKMIGGSRNDRLVRGRLEFVVSEVNPLEERMRALSDDGLLGLVEELRGRLAGGENRNSVKPEAFALIREASRRAQNHRQYDVQLVSGMVLDEGNIAEEATGEGKTVACYPAIFMAALAGDHSHVVTVSDYHVHRDATFAQPVFAMVGMTVGYIISNMHPTDRQQQYRCDITYGTNSEFGFDYLRDNMKLSTAEQVQSSLDFAIVDEVDSILIDEARTPLIISGPAHGQTERFVKADAVARELFAKNRPWDRVNRQAESLKRQIKTLEGEVSKQKGDKAKSAQKQLDQAQEQLIRVEDELFDLPCLYKVELDKKSAHMTDEGVAVAQDIAGVGSFYVGVNIEWPHLMDQSLRAHLVFEKDIDYVVQNQTVVIVDSFTGRLMEGREWSDGLHQAIEAKERVKIKQENQTLATITIQNYFRMYSKLAGMTGTALTEAEEFMKIYKLDVIAVPTHRPINRKDFNDRIYADDNGKFNAIVEEVNNVSKAGRPVLVGTTSVEKSERLSEMITRAYGIEHQVLNARPENAGKEADIVTFAGQQKPLRKGSKEMVGTVTIATNMAGRGTDIKLGTGVVYENCHVPSEEKHAELAVEVDPLFPPGVNKCCICCQQYDPATNCAHCFKPKLDDSFPDRGRKQCPLEVPCGLHIIGTERHEARRIDNQLRGRSGRQGDPGSTRFFLSLRDELIALFAPDWMLKVLGWLGLQDDQPVEHKRVSKGIERAQRRVEERNYERRKNLLEYDEVMDHQRKTFYGQRQGVLEGRELQGALWSMVLDAIAEAVWSYLDPSYPKHCLAQWAKQHLQITLEPERIAATTPDAMDELEIMLRSRAKDEARQTIAITLGEYMDEDFDQNDWDIKGLSSWAMSRFGVQLSQNHLRKMDPSEVEESLSQAAEDRIDKIDLTDCGEFLAEDFARGKLASWAHGRFAISIDSSELSGGPDDVIELLIEKAQQAYRQRETEYGLEYAMERTIGSHGVENTFAMDSLAQWANIKFHAGLTGDDLGKLNPREIHAKLLDLSQQWIADEKITSFITDEIGREPSINHAIDFAKEQFDTTLTEDDFGGDDDVFDRLVQAGKHFLRREMTELERFVLLQVYDSSWKDHLLAMDHLKESIGLRSYAEQDPRVAYKREGAAMFQEMLTGVRDKVTDMIFKIRLSAGEEMMNVYQISSAVHEQLSGYDHLAQDMAEQQEAAAPRKIETIRRDIPRVGRNELCPCGSGKKYKKCCGKNSG